MAAKPHKHGRPGGVEPAKAQTLAELVQYAEGSIVSRTLVATERGTLTLFAFDEGQGLNEHTTPFDAYLVALEGRVELTIGGEVVDAAAGQLVLMPANVPHAVWAAERFKMMLIMIRA